MRFVWILFIANYSQAHSLDSLNVLRDVNIQSDFYKKYAQIENLQKNASIYIKNYGDGQLSSFSYRGFTAQQTQIRWNQIDISSPFLGQMDLSTLSYSLEFNSSTPSSIGGILNINTTPFIENNINSHLLELKCRSQNLYQIQYNYAYKKNKNSLMLDFDLKKGINNFTYRNQNNEINQIHNGIEQYSFLLDYRVTKKSQHQFSIWQSNTQREIAPTISSQISHSIQRDHSIRLLYGFENKKKFSNKSALMVDNLIYRDSMSSINSRSINYSLRNILQTKWQLKSNSIKLKFETNGDALNTNNYTSAKYLFKQYSELSSTFPIKKSKTSILFGIAHTFQNNLIAYPLPFASILTTIIEKNQFRLSTEFHTKIQTRFPTGNDWYWVQGGNSNLLPEYSYQADWKNTLKYKHIQFVLNPFLYYTDNLIQWTPTDKGYWQVENIKAVYTKGVFIETSIDIKPIHLISNYQFLSKAIGPNQIIYVPQHKSASSAELNIKKFSTHLDYIFTSDRFTTTDNSQFLPSYHLIDWSIQQRFDMNKIQSQLRFTIKNLFNEDYNEVANRPMPLRLYEISLKINWAPKTI